MLRAAVHIAEEMVFANHGGSEPHLGVSTRNNHELNPECWDIEVVDDVLSDHGEFDIRVDWYVKSVVFTNAVWMLNVPHPLFSYDVNFLSVFWWNASISINLGTPAKKSNS